MTQIKSPGRPRRIVIIQSLSRSPKVKKVKKQKARRLVDVHTGSAWRRSSPSSLLGFTEVWVVCDIMSCRHQAKSMPQASHPPLSSEELSLVAFPKLKSWWELSP